MSEEKKRVRPTLGQVRALEECIAALKEVITERDVQLGDLEIQLSEEKKRYAELCERASQCAVTLDRLRRRGFWSRLFNKS